MWGLSSFFSLSFMSIFKMKWVPWLFRIIIYKLWRLFVSLTGILIKSCTWRYFTEVDRKPLNLLIIKWIQNSCSKTRKEVKIREIEWEQGLFWRFGCTAEDFFCIANLKYKYSLFAILHIQYIKIGLVREFKLYFRMKYI